ncbi:DUF664 domain-containing protein [Nocardia flavorosea]|uniref:mycothiol transferase n=1 Tax=Nocardia flavorosea TaxID=53429 RepID=UPI001FE1CEC2|nr:DUF664 domain-containing protein [Nocardia flavorosea]
MRPLTDEQSRRRLVPSLTTPIALIKHCAAAERIWFQRTIGGVEESQCDGYAWGDDQSWVVPPMQTLEEAIAEYEPLPNAHERSRAPRSRAICSFTTGAVRSVFPGSART